MTFDGAVIAGAVEVPYRRRPEGVTTLSLFRDAFRLVLADAEIDAGEVDGLAIASFSLAPDRAINLAWHLGLTLRWSMEDTHAGASGINMLQHAVRAVQCGDASVVVVMAADHQLPGDFTDMVNNFSSVARKHLAPLGYGGPNALFSLVTQAHMRKWGLAREDYGAVCMAQRAWAAGNPLAVYREPLTMDAYLNAPMVAAPLGRFDCVPLVSGADAIVVTRGRPGVRLRALRARHNFDQQDGDGLVTGLRGIAGDLWAEAGCDPAAMDLVSVYDDYPVMVLVQLADLGFVGDDVKWFIAERLAPRGLPVNTSGGQLSVGQAGAAGGLHGLVEAVTQLRGRAGGRQVPDARLAAVSGYGMVEYRYCLCANAVVLERAV
jgi:acetyl-CoA acetyltransferase